jgi:ribosome biogenesis SPOUT family RNA methylase Rps3
VACYVTSLSFTELTSSAQIDLDEFKDDTKHIRTLLLANLKNEENLANVCFMDMRAEAELSPADAKTFNFVVFGGILGDHPPQDRAKEFRESFK